MNWKTLDNKDQINSIVEASGTTPQLIFKHSTRCMTSSMIKNRLYKNELPEGIDFYYLDLIAHRDISNLIAEKFGVEHESPQVLLIKQGKCLYHESHMGIYMEDILTEAG